MAAESSQLMVARGEVEAIAVAAQGPSDDDAHTATVHCKDADGRLGISVSKVLHPSCVVPACLLQPPPLSCLQRQRANHVNELRWDSETPTTEAEAEALQERIWDLHDKLSHAILTLSSCTGLPACHCWGALMPDARGLHAIRAVLEVLEGQLHFLRVSASPPSRPLLLPAFL
ncbi:hypothetical protein ZWY2020_057479 [Hordeum vulgare]|nr:hypothetical protein ZWY2020_057479 [Hordeum vulgare]